MSTNYTVHAIIGIALKDLITHKQEMRSRTRFREEDGTPYEKPYCASIYTFAGKEYEIPLREEESGWMGDDPGMEDYKPTNELFKALESSFEGLDIFLPPYAPQDGYVGVAVGNREDQGQWGVFNGGTRGDVADAFAKVQEVTGQWPTLNLLVTTC